MACARSYSSLYTGPAMQHSTGRTRTPLHWRASCRQGRLEPMQLQTSRQVDQPGSPWGRLLVRGRSEGLEVVRWRVEEALRVEDRSVGPGFKERRGPGDQIPEQDYHVERCGNRVGGRSAPRGVDPRCPPRPVQQLLHRDRDVRFSAVRAAIATLHRSYPLWFNLTPCVGATFLQSYLYSWFVSKPRQLNRDASPAPETGNRSRKGSFRPLSISHSTVLRRS